jgi:hypothetical protein
MQKMHKGLLGTWKQNTFYGKVCSCQVQSTKLTISILLEKKWKGKGGGRLQMELSHSV